ncbi:hypothetical protein HY065_01230, partial [Candidatus Berkelbacteria bacterium]|nr:hypothetical protein [Candidatus Berkelbacteria bacterium]
MRTKLQYAALGAGSIVVALAMAATAGAAGLDDALYHTDNDAFTRDQLTVTGDLLANYPIYAKGKQINGNNGLTIDFKTAGASKIYDDPAMAGGFTIRNNDTLTVDASQLLIKGGRKITFNGAGAANATIELFSSGSRTASIVGDGSGNVTIDSTAGAAKVSALKGLSVVSNSTLGTNGNGVVSNTVNLGESQTENVAITRTFIADTNLK